MPSRCQRFLNCGYAVQLKNIAELCSKYEALIREGRDQDANDVRTEIDNVMRLIQVILERCALQGTTPMALGVPSTPKCLSL